MEAIKYWTPQNFEISSYRWPIESRISKIFRTSGSDNTGKCLYSYNELGFRSDSIFKKGFKVLSLGCSITEGVGVNDNETWPAFFSNYFENGVNFNFAVAGRSNDYISRCLLTYYDIVKPDLILIMYTFPNRREFYTEDCNIEPFAAAKKWGWMDETEKGNMIQNCLENIQNENEDLINWYKNHLLIKYFLQSKKANWIWNGWALNTNYVENNRFDGEYKNFISFGVDGAHPGPSHNYKYSLYLINFIKEKFPDYLPSNFVPNHKLI